MSGSGMSKGHSSSRGRPYGMMLLVAFGAAVMGVMLLHKLRERRIFNLLVKEKDAELLTLHLLLQKERDSNKEAVRKAKEMKAKLYSFRIQKMVLDRRIMEMQSTVASLKDEQRTMESALEEKQNEIEVLREKEVNSSKEDPQLTALKEVLKQKEDEIEDFKHHLEYPANIWSVSIDDPSNPPVNLTAMESLALKDRVRESTSRRDQEHSTRGDNANENELTNLRGGENSMRGKENRENLLGIADRREMTGGQVLKKSREEDFKDGGATVEKRIDGGQENKNERWQDGGRFILVEEESNANATDVIEGLGNKIGKITNVDGDTKTIDDKEHKTTIEGHQEKLKISQGGKGQVIGAISKGGIKLEMPDSSQNGAAPRVGGKHGYGSKTKGTRWRMLAKSRGPGNNGNSENSGAASMKSRRFSKDTQENERYEARRGGELKEVDGHQDDDISLRRRHESDQENRKLEISEKFQRSEGLRMSDDSIEKGVASSEQRTEIYGGEKGEGSSMEARKAVVSTTINLLKPQNSEKDAEDLRITVTDANKQAKTNSKDANFEEYHHNREEVLPMKKSASETASDDGRLNLDEFIQSKVQEGSDIQQQIDRRNINEEDSNAKQKDAASNEEPEDMKIADIQEPVTDYFKEFSSNLKEDEESGQQTDEPEF